MCVCSQLCQFTVKSVQPPPPPTPICGLSLLFLPISLSDEQIELLNELFLWAPNAHPQLSICSFPPSTRLLLPPSPHPSTPSPLFPQPHSYFPNLPAATMFTVYLQAQKHMYAHTSTSTQSPIRCTDVCTCNLPADLYMPNLFASGKIWEIGKKAFYNEKHSCANTENDQIVLTDF